MFYLNYSANNSYQDYLVSDIQIYDQEARNYHSRTEFGVVRSAVEVSNPRDEVYETFRSLRKYKKYIDNKTPAESLESLNPNEIKHFDNYANFICCKKLEMMDKIETNNIKTGRTLFRVNDKNQVVYTVSKVGDWFVFKNFSLAEGYYHGPGYGLRLYLNSVWYVKQLPDIEKFKNILPYDSTIDDVIKIDPNFRCYQKDGVLYSTHFFADKRGHAITIKYYKNIQGIYKVENITTATEGYNLLPYLLPIDRKLIDPNYTFEPEEERPPQNDPKNVYGRPIDYCSIM